jgi:mono/diheme cytochrome c family protein
MFCHSRAAGFVLGLNTAQMNRTQNYAGGARDNQLRTYEHIGLFKKPLPKRPGELAAYPDPFGTGAELETRVKAYLAVNCAMCHVSDGGGNSKLEVAYATAMKDAGLVDAMPLHDTFGIADARIVAPGSPERSVLHARIARRGEGQMPPTSSNRVDERGRALVAEWIRSLGRR